MAAAKRQGSLKFAANFKEKLSLSKKTEVSSLEDNYNRPQILQKNGLSLSAFDTQEAALKLADEIIRLNEKTHGHPHDAIVHESMPLLNKVLVRTQRRHEADDRATREQGAPAQRRREEQEDA